jgi:hypothetical protein
VFKLRPEKLIIKWVMGKRVMREKNVPSSGNRCAKP